MHPWRPWMLSDDRGSASLEFLTLGTLLIVPLAPVEEWSVTELSGCPSARA